jgi:hypothetical protein
MRMFPSITDERLGFRGYCEHCVGPLVARCKRLLGRLPVPGEEFFCRHCDRIVRVQDLATITGGRRRWTCQPCRLRQIKEGQLRAIRK